MTKTWLHQAFADFAAVNESISPTYYHCYSASILAQVSNAVIIV